MKNKRSKEALKMLCSGGAPVLLRSSILHQEKGIQQRV